MDYPIFKKGQKVINQQGDILTVSSQNGCMVFVDEECMGHYHPTKLWPVK